MRSLLFSTLLLLCFNLKAQVPVTYGGGIQPAYYDQFYQGKYTLNENWVVVEKDTLQGYWKDSLFVSGNKMFIFKQDRIEKLTKCVPMNTLFKGCTAGDYSYWAIIAEYFNKEKIYRLVGFSDIDSDPAISILVQNPVHNTFTGQVRVEQNGVPFYLYNPIKNSDYDN